jgi:large subunit ribosomal protein L17
MKHQVAHRNFGRPTASRRAMFRIIVTDLLRHGRIKTTESKAKEIRPMAEKMITLGKGGSLHQRRQAAAFITDDKVVRKVFDEIAPRYKERNGGYTRLVRLGPRKGDAAEVALLELVP